MKFNDEGNLPPGIYDVTWEEFEKKFGHNHYRTRILRGIRRAIINLKYSGCRKIYLDGSFITNKYKPNDFDGCWESTNVDITLLDPILQDFDNGRKTQKAKYHGEFFPSSMHTKMGTFLEFFQRDKETGNPKGIICINLEKFV